MLMSSFLGFPNFTVLLLHNNWDSFTGVKCTVETSGHVVFQLCSSPDDLSLHW